MTAPARIAASVIGPRPAPAATPTRSGFATVFEDREVTRLGGSVFRTGILEPQAMEATIEALQRFHRAAQRHGAAAVRVVVAVPVCVPVAVRV